MQLGEKSAAVVCVVAGAQQDVTRAAWPELADKKREA